MNNSNDMSTIRGRIDNNVVDAFKKILSAKNMTQQEFLDCKIKEFIIENINLIVSTSEKKVNK